MSSADTAVDPPGWAGVGTCALSAGHASGPRLLSHHALMLTTAGHGPIEVDFTVLACRPGTLIWIHPGQALQLGPSQPSPAQPTPSRNSSAQPGTASRPSPAQASPAQTSPPQPGPAQPGPAQPGPPGLEASFVTFESRLARPPEPDAVRYWQLEGEDEDAVISDFAQLAVDCARLAPGAVAAALLHHQLMVLQLRLTLLAAAAPIGPESRTYARFQRLLEDGHPSSRRVEDYAADLGCSVRTLTRACLAVTGRTAKQVVDDRVALQARRLLACTPLPVAEVGRHLGFPEPTNFGRFFHREVGTSPGQFRNDRGNGGTSTRRAATVA